MGVAGQQLTRLTAGDIPQPHRAVTAAADQQFTVGAKGDTPDGILMPFYDTHRPAITSLPQADLTAAGAGRRLRELTANLDNVFFNIKSERHAFYQALLSLGDRRVAPVIEAAEANGGDWRRAVADTGVDARFFVFRDRSSDKVLPWSIIDGGMKESFFRSELDKSFREEWTLPPKRAAENAKLIAIER
jgi:hypothetical protein